MSDPKVCSQTAVPVKRPQERPVELTDYETQCLLKAFVHGQTDVLEEDWLTLITWAMAQRMGALLLEMMLEGTVCPIVRDGEVLVELAAPLPV